MKRRFANSVNGGRIDFSQLRVDNDFFKGYVCLAKIKKVDKAIVVNDGDFSVCILDDNYIWLEVYPDDEKYAITIMLNDKGRLIEWYFDMIKSSGMENGTMYIDDLYLDLVVGPDGRNIVLDENELNDALENKDITKKDYECAYQTLNYVKEKYVYNFEALKKLTHNLFGLFGQSCIINE